ncbi:MAG: M55 family metallopeptidase [Chloroflexota bacterium]
MRVFISVDMEGITGVSCWDDVDHNKPSFNRFREIMTAEVNAAIEGAYNGGAAYVLINDSHGGMRNILLEKLDKRAELISGYPKQLGMMAGVDRDIDRAMFIGYHAMAGTAHAVLDHTWSGSQVYSLQANGRTIGETGLNAAIAGHYGVPVVLVTGDQAVASEAKALLGDRLNTVEVKESLSRTAVKSLPVEQVMGQIKEAASQAVNGPIPKALVFAPPVTITIQFVTSVQAEGASALPGANRVDGRTVEWTGEDIIEAYSAMLAMLALA